MLATHYYATYYGVARIVAMLVLVAGIVAKLDPNLHNVKLGFSRPVSATDNNFFRIYLQ